MTVPGQEQGLDNDRKSSISLDKSSVSNKRESGIPGFVGPREFGRLLLLKAIARGGMGEVYLGAMGDIEGAERPCVVKLIRHEHRDDASFLARFLDEARIQAQMQHPGVAQVLEATIDPEGQPYVVVEYVAGRDLAELRQRASQLKLQIAWSDAVAIIASIADALAHVHERTDPEGRPLAVVHRDLSPQNIMVSYHGDTKLIDFGTARGENRRCQTINGIVFAKPGYVAPEVAANNPGGASADLYALGIVLWELIAGRRFLQGDSQEHLAAVAKGERTPPQLALWLALPRELDTVIARMTAPRISDRFASAREATEHLVKLLQQAPGLANGERSVRARIAHLMLRLYPAEPSRSRAEFAKLVAQARKSGGARPEWSRSPRPGAVEVKDVLFPGTRYRLVRELAHGPMSVVHEAQHVDLGRTVAIKVLDRQRCKSAEAAAHFRHEARVIAQLRHDNLVQIHDFGVSSDGRPYYAMEYLEGETLAERLTRLGRLPWADALEIAIQACQALEAAHALGVIHRDIKPANLFVTSKGTVKLLDFGINQAETAPDRNDGETLSLVGTPEYMAPEQIGEQAVDARADIYALGTVLYELITGYLPHMGANTVTLLDNKMHDKVKPASQRVRKLRLPRYLDRVLLTALATDTKDRYDNVTGLRQDLVWILASKERGALKRQRLVWGGVSAAAASLVIGFVAFDGLPPRGPYQVVRAATPMSAAPTSVAPTSVASTTSVAPTSVATTTVASAPIDVAPIALAPIAVPEPSSTASTLDGAPALDTTTDETASDNAADDDVSPADIARSASAAMELDNSEDPEQPSADPAPVARPAKATPARRAAKTVDPALENALVEAESLMGRSDIKALEAFRQLGERHPREPRVLEGWSRIAARTKWWGESLRVAERWAAIDPAPRAQIHLARTQKRLGHVEKAIDTLKGLLARVPNESDASTLLQLYGGSPIAMR